MRSLSLRLTHKITAIGVIGLIGVLLVGGIHLYGENAVAATSVPPLTEAGSAERYFCRLR